MCEPTTLAIASVAATVVSTGIGVIGQIQAGKAASQQSAYNAQVARNNAIIAEQQATLVEREGARLAADAIARGRSQEAAQRLATKQLIGRQRAVLAGRGVTVDVGSALDLNADAALLGEVDALTIRNSAQREALGFEQQAAAGAFQSRAQGTNFEAQAGLFEAEGSQAKTAAFTGAASTLVSGFGSVAQKWYGFNKAGVPGFGGTTVPKPTALSFATSSGQSGPRF